MQRGKLGEADRTPRWPGSPASSRLDELADVDLVVEAVVEELSVKRALFADLDEICKPGAVLATTTSSLPVIECAAATARQADVIGMHFFNPAAMMKLVEVVSTVATAADVAATALAVRAPLGKQPVQLRRPGRIHRQRAAVPLSQRRGEDAARRTTRTARTSTRR